MAVDEALSVAERVYVEATSLLIEAGVPPHRMAEAAVVNCIWHANNTGNHKLAAQRLRAAAELLERQEAKDGR